MVEPTVGSVTLRWQTPLANEDGTPLVDLAGYVIRYGLVKNALDQSVQVNDAGATSYVVGNLIEGTWYFHHVLGQLQRRRKQTDRLRLKDDWLMSCPVENVT